MMIDIYLGLGSNLANPAQQIYLALKSLSQLEQSSLIKVSSFYRSKPWGPISDQPSYVNAVAYLRSLLSPSALFAALKAIELRQGRDLNSQRWGPRCIDLDILLYGQQHWQDEVLTIPHARLGERDFVIYPLLELAPELVLPDGTSLKTLTQRCPSSLELLSEVTYEK